MKEKHDLRDIFQFIIDGNIHQVEKLWKEDQGTKIGGEGKRRKIHARV